MGFKRTRTSQQRRFERLEARQLLDGQGLTLGADVYTLEQNGSQTELDVLANDAFDPQYEGPGLITSASFGSEGGQIEIAPDGLRVLYTPPADFAGVETFHYAVDGVATAAVTVTIESPVADDEYIVPPNGASTTLDVLANDPFFEDYGGPGVITAVSVGSRGGVVEIGPDGQSIVYTAPIGSVDAETFVYVVDNSYPARVTVRVPDPLEADTYEVVQFDPARTLDVLANDSFYEGYAGERRITRVIGDAIAGVVGIAPDGGSLLYTAPGDSEPSAGYDEITYVVDDRFEETARVRIHRPVADDRFEVDQDSIGFEHNVTANDRYRVGTFPNARYVDTIDVVTAVTASEKGGTVTISDDGQSVVYTPAPGFLGVDRFTYTADGLHTATVTVDVTRPVRDDHRTFTVYQDTPSQRLLVLANDFLGNGYAGPRAITAVGPTTDGGSVSLSADGSHLLYTPAAGYVGRESFTYTVDGELTAEVAFDVLPLVNNDNESIHRYTLGASFTYDVLSNDLFSRGYLGSGQVTSVERIEGDADFTYRANGLVTVTPRADGRHVFRYVVDGQYEGTLTVSIPRQTAADRAIVDQNSGASEIAVIANDFPYRRYTSYSGPRFVTEVGASQAGGTVAIVEGSRSVVYTPPVDFYGRDTFTYTVDGFWTETVQVEVIRRVRDDLFRVDSDDATEALPVLVNDLFGADYEGQGVITGVTASVAGATVQVDPSGEQILYTPAAGFVGTDTFTYTVDGVLKAEVAIVVDTPASERAATFEGVGDFVEFLIDEGLERYAAWFGQPTWGVPIQPTLFNTSADSLSRGGERNHSETNVQVAGVDEGDLVEFDADYAYALTDTGVTIAHAWPEEEMSVVSRVDVAGRPLVAYLHGDRLTVVSEAGGRPFWRGVEPLVDGNLSISRGLWPIWPSLPTETVVTVIDVTDRAAPEVVQSTALEGHYVDSRSVDGQVYTLVRNSAFAEAPIAIDDDDDDPTTPTRYETAEEYAARLKASSGEVIESALPTYTANDGDGQLVRTGLLNTPETIHRPLSENADTLISVVSIDSTSDDPGLRDTAAVSTSDVSTVYASLDSFYVFGHDASPEDGAVTRIAKFDWDPASGGIDFTATTTVPGRIVNQFSVDEDGEYLRIATTASNSFSGNWTGRDENLLFVLREDGGVIETVGSIQNWALDERIRSVRFLGDQAFVSTFRTVDPLFAIDLSDPTSPEAIGHVTLPGFTSYMQLVGEDHLLTVGRNTPNGAFGPTQVALFDISNLAQPLRVAEHTFSRFSTSEAEIDHHAFGYFAEHGLLAIPVASTHVVREDADGDGYAERRNVVREDRLAVFTVDVSAGAEGDRLVLTAEIEHDTAVRRSGFIGDNLYSVGSDLIKAVAIAEPKVVVAEAALREPNDDMPVLDPNGILPLDSWIIPIGLSPPTLTPISDPRADAIAAAREHLAERLGVAPGEPLLVTSEATPDAPGGGEAIGFRLGDATHWYRIGLGDHFEPASVGYAFDASAEAWNAATVPTTEAPTLAPGDFNGDGRVDAADHDVWRLAYGARSLNEFHAGDANLDGRVDLADYTVWRDHEALASAAPPGEDETAAAALAVATLPAAPGISVGPLVEPFAPQGTRGDAESVDLALLLLAGDDTANSPDAESARSDAEVEEEESDERDFDANHLELAFAS